ncbi:MAG: hypothetical protein D6785_05355 [Planctomycetota bacterium]|nr:MAG: hypothetical protein D6785_05355 [Planctomycetota bacterium]
MDRGNHFKGGKKGRSYPQESCEKMRAGFICRQAPQGDPALCFASTGLTFYQLPDYLPQTGRGNGKSGLFVLKRLPRFSAYFFLGEGGFRSS